MKSILVLCLLIGLSSSVPTDKVILSDHCTRLATSFNVLATYSDFEARIFDKIGTEDMNITVKFSPASMIGENCALVNTDRRTLGVEMTFEDSLYITVNGEPFNTTDSQVTLNYIIYGFNPVHYYVTLAEVTSLGSIKSYDKDVSIYGETLFKPTLNDALRRYAKENWSFYDYTDESTEVGTNVELAIKSFMKAILTKVAATYV